MSKNNILFHVKNVALLWVIIEATKFSALSNVGTYYDPYDKLYPCFTVATELSFSPGNIVVHDYMNMASDVDIYNYKFELGYCFSRLFSGMFNNHSRIRQFGVLIGTGHYVSSFDKKDENIVFSNDKSQTPYLMDRSFVHNTHYLTLRMLSSVQFDFMPKNLLFTGGVIVGYKYLEEYEHYLRGKEKIQSEHLPSHTIRQTEDNIYEYLIHKPAKPEDLLLCGFNIGLAYQIPLYSLVDQDGLRHQRVPHCDFSAGIRYERANVLGHTVQNYVFYGISCRLTFEVF